MPLQIAKPSVVAKVEALATAAGLTKTALVERAVDKLALDMAQQGVASTSVASQWAAVLSQLQQVPDRPDAFEATPWDSEGLPL